MAAAAAGAPELQPPPTRNERVWFAWSLALESVEGVSGALSAIGSSLEEGDQFALRWQVRSGRTAPQMTDPKPIAPPFTRVSRSQTGRKESIGAEITDGVKWEQTIRIEERLEQLPSEDGTESWREKMLMLTLLRIRPGAALSAAEELQVASMPLSRFIGKEKKRKRIGHGVVFSVAGRATRLSPEEAQAAHKAAQSAARTKERASAARAAEDPTPVRSATATSAVTPAEAAPVDAAAQAATNLFSQLCQGGADTVSGRRLALACRHSTDPSQGDGGGAVRQAVLEAFPEVREWTQQQQAVLWQRIAGLGGQAARQLPDAMHLHEFVAEYTQHVVAHVDLQDVKRHAQSLATRFTVMVITHPGADPRTLELRPSTSVQKALARCQEKLGMDLRPDAGLWLRKAAGAAPEPTDTALADGTVLAFVGGQGDRRAVSTTGVESGSTIHVLPCMPVPADAPPRRQSANLSTARGLPASERVVSFVHGDVVCLTEHARQSGAMWKPRMAAGGTAVVEQLFGDSVALRCEDPADDCVVPATALRLSVPADRPPSRRSSHPPPTPPAVHLPEPETQPTLPGVGVDLAIELPIGGALRISSQPRDTIAVLRQRVDSALAMACASAPGETAQWLSACSQLLVVDGKPYPPGPDDSLTLQELGVLSGFSAQRRVELRFLMQADQMAEAAAELSRRRETLAQLSAENEAMDAQCRGGREYLHQMASVMEQHAEQQMRRVGAASPEDVRAAEVVQHQMMRDAAGPDEGELVRELRDCHDEIASCAVQSGFIEQLEMELPRQPGTQEPQRLGALLRMVDERSLNDELTERRERRAVFEELKEDELRYRQAQIRTLRDGLRSCNDDADRLLEQWRELQMDVATTDGCAAEIRAALGMELFEVQLTDAREDLGVDICECSAGDLPKELEGLKDIVLGVEIKAVVEDSAAHFAGVQPGILYTIDGARVRNTEELQDAMHLLRSGGRRSFTVQLEVRTSPGWPTRQEMKSAADSLRSWARVARKAVPDAQEVDECGGCAAQ
eukprot:TRINITY_DN6220_c6_g1_i1.p1 TRINITY_DN6220_c6_g1~~TRINITY_DN6220_c6_g1_i1.p1  ORF type:complete len:1024 (+),score=359.85 TRINITY_DN6220_c6_g1_i1:84-3155(+)